MFADKDFFQVLLSSPTFVELLYKEVLVSIAILVLCGLLLGR